ncbi:hypothetical protein [Oceanobacillus chungangensis]|uniref:hypothetical protein n=1 Tax=Oceanobacillus chungangensis TaxID=1229152 RepID=UPI001473044D|nr:hypothetical protein [Oceanobacillus chungangensis]
MIHSQLRNDEDIYEKIFRDTFDSSDILEERIGEAVECPTTIEDSKHRMIFFSLQ